MLKTFLTRLARDEKGASLVEYGVALIVVVTAGTAAVSLLGTETAAELGAASTMLQSTP